MIEKNGRCVISFFYIKPQPANPYGVFGYVALYLSSTSNHNRGTYCYSSSSLRYIFLLHQTTTSAGELGSKFRCVISFFYIKPQHQSSRNAPSDCCVISFFYIKPQLANFMNIFTGGCVISFFYIKPQLLLGNNKLTHSCVISFFYIKPQPRLSIFSFASRCVISFFYIKPQHWVPKYYSPVVALYLSSTSNHNLNN